MTRQRPIGKWPFPANNQRKQEADTLELDRATQLQAMTAHVTVFAVPFASLMARWGHVRAEVWAVSCLTASGRLGRVAANGV